MTHIDISQWLLAYRYLIIFPLTVIEGPITTVTAGILSSLGFFNAFVVYAIVVAGDLAGDTLYYSLGRWGRKPLSRWGKFIGFNKERLEKIDEHFKEHGGKTLIAAKLSHAVGAIALISAGISHLPYRRFIFFNFWATLPKSLVLILIGYYFGNTFLHFKRYFDYAWLGTLVIAIALLLFYFVLRKAGKKLSGE